MPIKPMPNKEHAIEIEGLDPSRRSKYQPPVQDKKTGEFYDLNDPEFPVVQDHEFRTKYWTTPHNSTSSYLKYIDEHWEWFNKSRFQGQLKKPRFGLLKDLDAMRMRLRGRFTPPSRTQYESPGLLELSPNLFNAPHEGWINRTLIHEMCHEAVWEVDGIDAWDAEYKQGKGHGTLWMAWMRHAKLPPSRFDDTKNEMYMGIDDHKRDQERKDFRQKLTDTSKGRVLVQQPKMYLPVMFLFRKEEEPVHGILIGPVAPKQSEDEYEYKAPRRSNREPSWYYINPKDKRVYKASLRTCFYLYGNENEQYTTPFWKQEVLRQRMLLEERGLISPV